MIIVSSNSPKINLGGKTGFEISQISLTVKNVKETSQNSQ